MVVRTDLLNAYRAGIDAVNGANAVSRWLAANPLTGPVAMVALGKAAPAMAEGAMATLGPAVKRGLVVCPEGHANMPARADIEVLESAHPVPDRRSVAAGEALVDFVAGLGAGERLLVLLSGGTSSLVELPVAGVDIDALASLNQRLLADGYDIETINAARKSLSRIKGGRLASWLDGRPATVLAISDVPGNALHVIGSGLLHPDPAPRSLPAALESRLQALRGSAANPPPRPGAAALSGVEAHVVADNATALRAATGSLSAAGYRVISPGPFLTGDVSALGPRLAQAMATSPPDIDVLAWGGEPTVRLPASPGRGGRMHALAAEMALALMDCPNWALVAAGTDGLDGNSGHAGALLDADMARALGPAVLRRALRDADTAACLESAGAVIDTGPTGTNVMDLVLATAIASRRASGDHTSHAVTGGHRALP